METLEKEVGELASTVYLAIHTIFGDRAMLMDCGEFRAFLRWDKK